MRRPGAAVLFGTSAIVFLAFQASAEELSAYAGAFLLGRTAPRPLAMGDAYAAAPADSTRR